jgi:hypothetical protein
MRHFRHSGWTILVLLAIAGPIAACATEVEPGARSDTLIADTATTAASGKEICVYNQSDGRLIGRLRRMRAAAPGADSVAIVELDSALARQADVSAGTTWDITVPRNGIVRACE